jgi:hypothetical protein
MTSVFLSSPFFYFFSILFGLAPFKVRAALSKETLARAFTGSREFWKDRKELILKRMVSDHNMKVCSYGNSVLAW